MDGRQLVENIPSEDIGGSFGGWEGVFDASPETARRLIELGRKEARKGLAEAGREKRWGQILRLVAHRRAMRSASAGLDKENQ